MSGQWEVVGKRKDKNSGKSSAPQKPKDKKIANGVKVEEVLPMSQIKNLYAPGKNNKENQRPQEKANKGGDGGAKKPQKKPENKPPQEPKPKVPKSIESALNAIKPEEFNAIYEKNRNLFPDTPIVWLKEMAQFLNLRVPVEVQDPVFSNKAENYPLSVMPTSIKSILEKAVNDAGVENASVFFDVCLTAMANDMNKDLPALGHKFFLQYLASTNPKLAVGNTNKYVLLRNSYQNRQPIGLSILWALGQGGIKDLSVGMKVFQEIMLPLLEMKNYSRFVMRYLLNLIGKHRESFLSKEQYLLIVDVCYSGKKNMPADLTKELLEQTPTLNEMVLRKHGAEKYYSFIEPFLKKLTQYSSKPFRDQLCDVLVACLAKDHNCFGTWGKVYTKHLLASAILLSYIEQNWSSASKKINTKIFVELLKTYSVTNEELYARKRKEEGLKDAMDTIKKLTDRMANSKRSVFASVSTLLLILIPVFCTYLIMDIRRSGGWQNSATSKALNVSGFYKYSNKAYSRAVEGTQWVHGRIEEQFPGFTERTLEITMPYVELGRDLSLIAYNAGEEAVKTVQAKIPEVLKTIDSYVPGLVDKVRSTSERVLTAVVTYSDKAWNYVSNEVFVGKMSPSEMQKVFVTGVESLLDKANECYLWLYQKITNTIK